MHRVVVVGPSPYYNELLASALRAHQLAVLDTVLPYGVDPRADVDVIVFEAGGSDTATWVPACAAACRRPFLVTQTSQPAILATLLTRHATYALLSVSDGLAELIDALRALAETPPATPTHGGDAMDLPLTREVLEEVLSRRERQVARLTAEGLTNKEIAQRLSIEVTTVKNHVHSVLRKLGLSRRAQVSRYLRERALQTWT